MYKILITRLIIVAFLVGVSSVTAAQSSLLQYGEWIYGEINDQQPSILYNFEGEADDLIYATLLVENPYEWLPQLRLTGPNGATIAGVSRDGESILIGPLSLPATGTYGIEAGRPFDSVDGGSFNLRIDRAEVTTLESNAPFTSTLSGIGATHFFQYAATAGDLIASIVRGSAETGFWVVMPGGDFILESGFGDQWFSPVDRLPETGDYLMYVQTNVDDDVEFTLNVSTVQPQVITGGETRSGSSQEFPPIVFTFDTLAGKIWRLSGTAGDFEGDNGMEIFRADDLSGTLVSDYGSGPGQQPLIDPFIAPADGQYYVVLFGDDYDASTNVSYDYQFSLFPSTVVSLSPGSTITNTVTPESGRVRYLYNGLAGEVIRITLNQTGGDGYARLQILSPETVIFDMSAYEIDFRSAAFEIVIPIDGIYMFDVNNADYNPTNVEFSILLERVE